MEDLNYIGAGELVFSTENQEGISAGGFGVTHIMQKGGMTPIMNLAGQQGGGTNNISSLFENLVIPSWVLSYNNKIVGGGEYKDKEGDDEDIDDDLYDTLLGLVKDHDHDHEHKFKQNKKKKTQKPLKRKKNGTRKK